MATYFLRSMHISRGKGSVATRAAAYRAGERIKDERTGATYDYSDRGDIAYKEVVLPSNLEERADMAWAQDRAVLWNAMEHSGLRCNSRTAREWLMLLPPEMTPEQRVGLVRKFAAELADKYRCAVDLAIHMPRDGADPRNHHAHLLMTTREVSPAGIGARTTLELVGRERHERGLGPSRDEYIALRQRWAEVTNEALRAAGIDARVDHRSYERQGLNREPNVSIPEKVFYAERKYGRSAAGDAIRARHQERVAARLVSTDELARVVERQKKDLRERALEDFKRHESQPSKTPWAALPKEERNALRRERYEARRVVERQDSEAEARRRELSRERERAYRAKNPERVRERRREWRDEHRDEVNRNQREYRAARADELNLRRREKWHANADEANRRQREYRASVKIEREAAASTGDSRLAGEESRRDMLERQRMHSSGPTAEESGRDWLEYRRSHTPGPTAEESGRDWLEYRRTHGAGSTAEESAREWLAYRERQKQAEASQTAPSSSPSASASLSPSSEKRSGPERSDDRGDGRQPSTDHDLEL